MGGIILYQSHIHAFEPMRLSGEINVIRDFSSSAPFLVIIYVLQVRSRLVLVVHIIHIMMLYMRSCFTEVPNYCGCILMIISARQQLPSCLDAEVCVVGAGPAGIVLALELAAKGTDVLLIEGGALDSPNGGETLYKGDVTGRPYPLTGSRLRWFGGTSNHWGGWVRPFEEVDFAEKPQFDLPGWPIKRSDLDIWYQHAAEWCEVGSTVYEPDRVGVTGSEYVFPFPENSAFRNSIFRFSPPTRFGIKYREDIVSSDRISCWTDLNVVSLDGPEGRVNNMIARTLDGKSTVIKADSFVIAMGGIENARFLLNQRGRPGDQGNLLGRCFMDHFGFSPGVVLASNTLSYQRFRLSGHDVMPVISLSSDFMMGESLPNACMTLTPVGPDPFLPPDYHANYGRRGKAAGAVNFRVTMINEPYPHPSSAVILGDETDQLGMKRPILNWHLPESEYKCVLRIFREFLGEISALGFGRVKWTNTSPTPISSTPGVGFHHMGTTRMAASPEHGVVDPQCRVWDHENLYVTGSSVFPVAGYSNPTLTIVAMASRLAGHLGPGGSGG